MNGGNGPNSFGKHGPLLLACVIQIGVMIWWASSEGEKLNSLTMRAADLTTRVAQNETRVEGLQALINTRWEDMIAIRRDIKHLDDSVAAMAVDRKETVDHLKSIEESMFRVIGVIKNGTRR